MEEVAASREGAMRSGRDLALRGRLGGKAATYVVSKYRGTKAVAVADGATAGRRRPAVDVKELRFAVSIL